MPRATVQRYKREARGDPRPGDERGGTCPETSPRAEGAAGTNSSPTHMSLAEPQPRVPSKVHQRLCMDFLTGPNLSPGWRLGLGHEEQTNLEVFLAAPEPLVFWALSGLACDRRLPRGGQTQLKQHPGWRGFEHLFWKLL